MKIPKVKKLLTVYGAASVTISTIAVAYLLLLCLPYPLFAHSARHESYTVYSRQPIQEAELGKVLEGAESRLRTSPIYDGSIEREVFLTDSFGIYTLLSHKARNSFANSVPYIENIIINKSDAVADRVFMNREQNNSRSLSGVLAHEVTHILIQRRYGTANAIMMPTWKKEGYCEYIAGDSTITLDEGIRLWRENPTDDARYRYIKYHLMVKHLLENEKMTVDDLFTDPLDEPAVAARTFESLGNH